MSSCFTLSFHHQPARSVVSCRAQMLCSALPSCGDPPTPEGILNHCCCSFVDSHIEPSHIPPPTWHAVGKLFWQTIIAHLSNYKSCFKKHELKTITHNYTITFSDLMQMNQAAQSLVTSLVRRYEAPGRSGGKQKTRRNNYCQEMSTL